MSEDGREREREYEVEERRECVKVREREKEINLRSKGEIGRSETPSSCLKGRRGGGRGSLGRWLRNELNIGLSPFFTLPAGWEKFQRRKGNL